MSEMYIILDAAQATQVRGTTAPGAALEPMPLADGETSILPVAVLSDEAHAVRHGVLSALPCRTVAQQEWPGGEPPLQ